MKRPNVEPATLADWQAFAGRTVEQMTGLGNAKASTWRMTAERSRHWTLARECFFEDNGQDARRMISVALRQVGAPVKEN